MKKNMNALNDESKDWLAVNLPKYQVKKQAIKKKEAEKKYI